jgi:predicted nucleotidyltransferase
MHPVIENNRSKIIELCKQHHVKELYAFGSMVRDDFNAESDVDFIVSYFKDAQGLPTGNFDYFNLLFALENLTGKKVDLVSEDAINNGYFKERIDREKMQLYKA